MSINIVKRITVKASAAAASLSMMTVAKALKGFSRYIDINKLRVKQIAKRLGYINNLTAQSLRNGKTKLR